MAETVQRNKILEVRNVSTSYTIRHSALGGKKLTYGADAHLPEHVGFGFETLPDYEGMIGEGL